jgi:hypothetical protein
MTGSFKPHFVGIMGLLMCGGLPAGWAQSQWENICIEPYAPGAYAPCEPSIAIDPNDPAVLVAGAILDKVYTSADSGRTWAIDRLTSDFGVYGDPCVIASPKGFFYYFHLSNPGGRGYGSEGWLDRIVCQTSRTKGSTWNGGVGIGHNPPKDQDKEWAITNAKGSRVFVSWTQFDRYNSDDPNDSTVILFSRGNAKGNRWSKPVRLNKLAGNCLDNSGTAEGAVPATGRGNRVYVAWALGDTIWFDRSRNGGKTWLKDDIVATTIVGGWNQTIPGLKRSNGMPVTVCDRSGGAFDGRVYINWTDQRNGSDDTDVWVVWSDDEGESWSQPVRVNDDPPGKHQFFTWMTVDQSSGHLYAVFYDRRNYDDLRTDVFMAVSRDGGSTWENQRISESPFSPRLGPFFGDYNNITAVNGVVRPIWTRSDEGRTSVWTALIHFTD